MNIFGSRDIMFQIMLKLEMNDLRNFAKVNKLSDEITKSNYFWENRYKRYYPELTTCENINYRKVYKYKFIHTHNISEIYNVMFYHKEYKSFNFKLQIKTQKRSEIYNYIAHLYNYEDFPEKQYIKLSLIRALRKINEKRFNPHDRSLIDEFYNQYYNENSQMIENRYYENIAIDTYQLMKLKKQVTYSTQGFYGTNNLSLTDFNEKYKHIVLNFFDFLSFNNFRLDLNPPYPHELIPVSITASLIKKVINRSSGCIVMTRESLINL